MVEFKIRREGQYMKNLFKGIIVFAFIFLFGIQTETVKASTYYNTFVPESNGWSYYDNTGEKATNAWIYNGATYFVDENGKLVYGEKEIDGKRFQFDDTGKLTNDWFTLKDGKYVLASGTVVKNKQFILGDSHFYYNEKGELITGLHVINNQLYYLTNTCIESEGFRIVDNAWRYVYRDGRVAINQFLKTNNGTYYVSKNGIAFYGLKNIDGKTYYFDNSGVMQTGTLLINNTWRHFGEDGAMKSNEFFNTGNKTYYAKDSGSLSYGLTKISEKTYYFNNLGVMQTGTLLVNGAWRHFGEDGAMKAAEWFTKGDDKYYARTDGSLCYGVEKINGVQYKFDGTGKHVPYLEWIKDSKGYKLKEDGKFVMNEFRTIDGSRYYLNGDGYRAIGFTNYQNSHFFFDENGKMMRNTFVNVNGWRYFNENGIMPTNMWIQISSGIYHSDKGGVIQYGWQTIDDVQYYFNSQGQRMDVYYGVDISEHNGNVNWDALKSQNISFAIVRASFGDDIEGRADYKFEQNYAGAINNNLKVGVYHYSYTITPEGATREAEHILQLLNGRSLDTAVYFDIEDPSQYNLSKAEISAIIDAFCTTIENAGYKAGVYANLNWYQNRIDASVLDGRSVWVAQWNDTCDYNGFLDMWQYTSDAVIDNKRFDMNIWYR